MKPLMPFVIRIDADSSIRHNCLRTGGSHYDIFVRRLAVAVGNEIAHMIEMALGIAVDNLVIGYGSMSFRVPIDHADSPVYPPLLVEIDESVDDGFAQLRLHSEAGAVPVAGCTELAELLEYDASVLLLPLPGIFEELLTGEVLFFDAHILEFGNHLVFGSDACMVGTRNPAGILAVHSGLAD